MWLDRLAIRPFWLVLLGSSSTGREEEKRKSANRIGDGLDDSTTADDCPTIRGIGHRQSSPTDGHAMVSRRCSPDLAVAPVRFCYSRRLASNVPGPLESRRRLGKRQMADLHLHLHLHPAALPAAWTSAATSAAADLRRQWQWTPPRDAAARLAREADVRGVREAQNAWAAVVEAMPTWLSRMIEGKRGGEGESEKTEVDTLRDIPRTSHATAQTLLSEMDASLDPSFLDAFHTQLRLAALEPDHALAIFDRLWLRQQGLSDVAALFAAVLDGVRSCRLLQPHDLGPAFWHRLLLCAADAVTTNTMTATMSGHLAAEILLTAPPEIVRQLDPNTTLPLLLAAAMTTGSTAAIRWSSSSLTPSPTASAAWTSAKLQRQLDAIEVACSAGDLSRATTALQTARGLHQSLVRTLWLAGRLLSPDHVFAVAMAAVLHDVDPVALVAATNSRLQQMPMQKHLSQATRHRWLLLLAHLPHVRQDGFFPALHIWGAGLSLPQLCRLLLAHWHSRGYVTEQAALSFDRFAVDGHNLDHIALAALALAAFRSKHSRSRCVALLLSLCRSLQLLGRDAPTELARSVEALAASASSTTFTTLPPSFLEAVAWAADDVNALLRLYAVYAAQPNRSPSAAWSIAFWDKFADRMAAGLDDGSLSLTQVAYLLDLPGSGHAKTKTQKTQTQKGIKSPTIRLVERLAAQYALDPSVSSRQALRGVELCRTFLRRHRRGPIPVPSPTTLRALFHLVTRDFHNAQPGRTTRLRWYLTAVEQEHGPDVARTSALALARWRVLAIQAGHRHDKGLISCQNIYTPTDPDVLVARRSGETALLPSIRPSERQEGKNQVSGRTAEAFAEICRTARPLTFCVSQQAAYPCGSTDILSPLCKLHTIEWDMDWHMHQQSNIPTEELPLVKTEASIHMASFADHCGTFGLAHAYLGDSGSSQAVPATPGDEPAMAATKRRMRSIKSCLECRRRKLKCTKSQPCRNCAKADRLCLYLGHDLDALSKMQINGIKEKVAWLERELEKTARSRQRLRTDVTMPFRVPQQAQPAVDVSGMSTLLPQLQPSPLVADDDDDENEDDNGGDSYGYSQDMVDLGIRVGRMRITEWIGGLNRPRLAEEIEMRLSGTGTSAVKDVDSNRKRKGGCIGEIPDFLLPSDDYIMPASNLCCGPFAANPPVQQLLPPPAVCRLLSRRYRVSVHPVAPCLHWPSFVPQLSSFLSEVAGQPIRPSRSPRPSLQALAFAVLFSAAVATDEAEAAEMAAAWSLSSASPAASRVQLVRAVQCGLEASLTAADFLHTTCIETLQAFVLYLITLCRAEISRAHSVLVSAAIRMAECMGLHRDGQALCLTPLEVHIRRLLWHQLCFLDIRTCEAQGPRPTIRADDYDTRLPLNCREEDLQIASSRSPSPSSAWTPMLLAVIRFDINEMMRVVWNDRRRLEAHRISLADVMTKIEHFRRHIFAKYEPLLEPSDCDSNNTAASRRYTRLVMQLLVFRLHVMVLHPYHANTTTPLPDDLTSILLKSGVMIVETAAQIETNPSFAPWRWYGGTYQQYQVALLLATEVFFRPDSPFHQRIWRCLHFVFDVDPSRPSQEKSKAILREIMHKTAVYTQQRCMRALTNIAQAVPDRQTVRHASTPAGSGYVDSTENSPATAVLISDIDSNHNPFAAPLASLHPVHGHQREQQSQYRQQQQQQHHQELPWHVSQQVMEQHNHNPHPMAVDMDDFASDPSLHMAPPPLSSMPPPSLQIPLRPNLRPNLQSNLQPHPQPLQAPPQPLFSQNMAFAGVTNGEALWSLPQSQQSGMDSPEGFPGCSVDAALFIPPVYPAHLPLQSLEGLIWDEFENTFTTQL
ncbi:fungal specific transcription factor domain containing protein [Grosmannia clavigera kw1407]|uniref:Fungal specific transcription factor domain containing protein n=1 Tax=Grosmannia clavigera (strain kw1407 / UAMH 11150) TaxID=655863 RepID=F0XKQ9_GROCL|nr:fungal specific transcription factor domain containing protein [Grosmannia clavigera kw1407]EFX01835.1 fungal specific transcription factor domain containing protein [Grosmannia clavigera kw1407]